MRETPIQIHRTRTAQAERLVLQADDYTVTVEIAVRGIELDAGAVELMLHAPLTVIAERLRPVIDVEARWGHAASALGTAP